ncbi:lipopolysaccharide biosynthesis protein [Mucilaginibacter sp.]
MLSNIKKLSSKFGIDQAIAFTILTRIIQASGSLISIIFIAKFLSPNEQGYYYTFASIIAIQVFFELGLSGIITQYTAHEFAHLSWNNYDVEGDDYYKSRLSSLLRFCVKWFGIISIVLFFALIIIGFYFFSTFNTVANIDWKTPWVILCLATSLNLFIDPLLAYFDGLGEVKDMAKVRLVQKTINSLLLFLFLVLGFKLYSSAIAGLISIIINYIQIIFSKRIKALKAIWLLKGEWVVNYIKEIFPFQWRIALSWISGYLIFQLFNPVLFAYEGPKVAGQMGMTLQVINGISTLSMSWITTKIPAFSSFIAKHEYMQLDKLFNKTLKNVIFVNLCLLIFLNILIEVLKVFHISYYTRFLPLLPTIIISLTCFANQLVFSWATYLRCHKKEPFLVQSIVAAVIMCASIFYLGKMYGLMGVVSGYGILIIVFCLPWAYQIFTSKKTLWHSNV